MPRQSTSLAIPDLRESFRHEGLSPAECVGRIFDRIAERPETAVWIHLCDRAEVLKQARALEDGGPEGRPLYAIPFAVKDNIDVAGLPTTAGCPAFSTVPDATASVVQALTDAGALLIGKTNMDQFATGLTGARSPYGACPNPFDLVEK